MNERDSVVVGSVTTYELWSCMRLGFIKNLVLPEPEPPTTSTFLLLAWAGFFGLPDIISPSVCVRIMLFSGFGSIKGAISVLPPHEAFCQVSF